MPTDKESKIKKIPNDNLSVLYVDDMEFQHRADGFNYLVFTINLPDGDLEQTRLMIDDKHLYRIIEYLCFETDYFPEKDDE